jgi:phage tail tape-measure protein
MMTRRNVLRAVWQAGANADGGSNRETGKVPIFFAFASPVAVLVVGSCVFATLRGDRALIAQLAGAGFTAGAGLGAFGFGWEKEGGATFTRRKVGPMFRIFHCYWSGNLDCSDFRE